MKLTAKVKLQPTDEQTGALRTTLERANEACNAISGIAWVQQTFKQFPLHRLTYHDIKGDFGLSAQIVVRCIAKVADAYKVGRDAQRTFRPHGAIPYDSRILSWKLDGQTVSIWTLAGRQTIPYVAGRRDLELLRSQRGETDLCLVDGAFYLFTTCDVEEPEPIDVEGFLGIDMGIVNIVADSDGNTYSGGQVNGLRRRHRRTRKRLQSKGTKSANRLLKKRRRTERRFAKDVNHTISKRIVAVAQGTERGIAVENLNGIRERVTARRSQRATLHSWSFGQLRQFIEYKSRLAGVPVVAVDPRYTSQTCPECGYIDKRNRQSQSLFQCVSCGLAGPADTIAAVNIGCRAAVNQPDAATGAASCLL